MQLYLITKNCDDGGTETHFVTDDLFKGTAYVAKMNALVNRVLSAKREFVKCVNNWSAFKTELAVNYRTAYAIEYEKMYSEKKASFSEEVLKNWDKFDDGDYWEIEPVEMLGDE